MGKKGHNKGPQKKQRQNGNRKFEQKNKNGRHFNKNIKKGGFEHKNKSMNQTNVKPSLPLNQNKKKANLGEYIEYVGKSMFKLIPEGVDADYKDNFAALGGDS